MATAFWIRIPEDCVSSFSTPHPPGPLSGGEVAAPSGGGTFENPDRYGERTNEPQLPVAVVRVCVPLKKEAG